MRGPPGLRRRFGEQFDAVNGFEDLLMDLADGIGHGVFRL